MLGTPPAFVLSQDQTLIFDLYLAQLSLCSSLRCPSFGIDFASRVQFSGFRRKTFLVCLVFFLLCIVFKVPRRQFVSLADSLVILPHSSLPVNTFFEIFFAFSVPFRSDRQKTPEFRQKTRPEESSSGRVFQPISGRDCAVSSSMMGSSSSSQAGGSSWVCSPSQAIILSAYSVFCV